MLEPSDCDIERMRDNGERMDDPMLPDDLTTELPIAGLRALVSLYDRVDTLRSTLSDVATRSDGIENATGGVMR